MKIEAMYGLSYRDDDIDLIEGGIFGTALSSREELISLIDSSSTWSFSQEQIVFETQNAEIAPNGVRVTVTGEFAVKGVPSFPNISGVMNGFRFEKDINNSPYTQVFYSDFSLPWSGFYNATWPELLSGNDVIIGDSQYDVLAGYGGNDFFYADLKDQVFGGSGIDTVKLAGKYAEHSIEESSDIWNNFEEYGKPYLEGFRISKVGSNYRLSVVDVERIEFDDLVIALDANGTFSIAPSQSPTPDIQTSSLDILVSLFGNVFLLKGLKEVKSTDAHTVEYNGEVFNYEDVDFFVTTVVRDGEFTDEFAQEIADAYPEVTGIKYSVAASIVGSALDEILIQVAGADGNYIG